MRVVFSVLLISLFAIADAHAEEHPSDFLLFGARVLDASGERFLEGVDVLISTARIVKVGPADTFTVPDGTKRIDLTGLSLIPGLIDLHSHLLLHPYDEASWNDQVLKESLELRTVRAVAAMRATLEGGFTTLRDLGTEGAGYADVALRDAVSQQIVVGPRIFAVTRALVATGCYGPSGFDPRWKMPKGAQVADGIDGVRVAVREQIAAGADWIKVYADYRRKPGDAPTPTYTLEELAAIVDEARSAGLSVASHAVTNEAIRRSVLAGVKTIEHGTNASGGILKLMRERKVALCPTLAASEAMARYSGWSPGMADHKRITTAKAMFKRALASGVTIACGSDVGVFSHGQSVRELELMVEYGMAPKDALASATSIAAEILGHGHDLGRIAEGYFADLIAIQGNPLEDISTVRNLLVVMKDGALVVDRR